MSVLGTGTATTPVYRGTVTVAASDTFCVSVSLYRT